ncbi:MAG: TonB-dependent receptor [Saprospiraceae bacterium]
MKFRFPLLVSLLVGIAALHAQDKGVNAYRSIPSNASQSTKTITGKVINAITGKPLQYSTIAVYSSTDSTIVAGGITDRKGRFTLFTNLRSFYIKIEFLSYQPKIIKDLSSTSGLKLLDLGTIKLNPIVKLLDAVDVRAEKSWVSMSLDKRVFNVGKDLISQGGTAEDILRNVPGVWVDINGEVTLRSSGSVRVLLNGQTSLLISGKDSDGLRQLQANSIDRIEIITNPSARYEAEGMAGIINIVLKKEDQVGLNGSLSANAGHPDNFGLGFGLNYRKEKINLFTGSGGWLINRPGTGQYRNQFFNLENPDSTLFSNMDRTHERNSMPVNFKIGADYYLNPNNTFTGSFYYRGSRDENTSELVYKDAFGSSDNVHLITLREEKETGKEYNYSSFLRHRKFFKNNKEHQLTTDVRYESEFEKEKSFYHEGYFDGNNNPLNTTAFDQITENNSGNDLLIIKSDYIRPLGLESNFEAGFQTSFRNIDNDYKVKDVVNNIETPDPNFTNNFVYHEVINALYANYGNKIKRFSYQAGVRAEHSDVESTLEMKDQTKKSNYFNFFPSAFLGYDLGNDNGFQLSYSRRIERPGLLDLTPFFTLRDRRNIWKGNPEIKPEFTNAFELGYIQYGEKGTLSAIAYFRRTTDVIKRIQRLDDRFPEATITQAENLDLKRNVGVEFTYSYALYKWWRLNGDMNFFHSFSGGTYEAEGEEIYVGGQSFSLASKTISRFTFWKKLNTQLTFNYSAPRRTTQGVNRATAALDFATSMDILKNNATVTLSVTDVFNSRRRRSFSEDETFYSEDDFLWQKRALILSFHYRLNQHKKQSQIYSSPIKEDSEERF